MRRWVLFAILVVPAVGCAHLPSEPAAKEQLRFGRDTFAFANETVMAYKDGVRVSNADAGRDPHAHRYSRNCFVMSRAVIQFWKFARFDPAAPPVSDRELAVRVRQVAHRASWSSPLSDEKRIVFPGFASLNELSQAKTEIMQENLGSGLATYFRVGNWSMPFVPTKAHQARTNAELESWLAKGYPVALWLYNFPSLTVNHVVVAFARDSNDGTNSPESSYLVYDPNYADRPFVLKYDPNAMAFSYEHTFYFIGGPVSVRIIYKSFLQ